MDHSDSRTEAIDRALDSLRAQVGSKGSRESSKRPRRWTVKGILRTVIFSLILLLVPFLLLAKVAVWLYLEASTGPWLALAAGALATTMALTLATMFITYRISGRFVPTRLTVRAIGLLVGVYCIYSLVFISGANVKSEAVAETYRSLHPLLRLGVSTLVVADDRLVVTDAARVPEDYLSMGLSINEGSLHYEQTSGYVHAVDVRTIGRSPLRNSLVAGYFRLMGFKTLRHVGTADHLHVSLAVR